VGVVEEASRRAESGSAVEERFPRWLREPAQWKASKGRTMKITLASVVVAVAFLVVMSLAPSAMATSTGTVSSKGPLLDADVSSTDSNGIYREIFVEAGTTTSHTPGGPPANSPFVFVEYFYSDPNTGVFDAGSGFIDGTFTIAKNLTTGSVTASGTAYSFYDGSAHTVTVDLSLTASGSAFTESYVEHRSVGTIKNVFKFSGTDQPATATGDASLDGVDLGSFTSNFADLQFTKSSVLTVSSP
jgi:hypothetical protein